MTNKELFRLLLILMLWTSAGLIVGWCMAVFQQHSHVDDLRELAEVRSAGNLLIGSIGGLLAGIIKVVRG